MRYFIPSRESATDVEPLYLLHCDFDTNPRLLRKAIVFLFSVDVDPVTPRMLSAKLSQAFL